MFRAWSETPEPADIPPAPEQPQMGEPVARQIPPNRFVTFEELQQHSLPEERIWIAICGIVYDVQGYIDQHPGGADTFYDYAGTDATQYFLNVGHSPGALNNVIAVGYLLTEEPKSLWRYMVDYWYLSVPLIMFLLTDSYTLLGSIAATKTKSTSTSTDSHPTPKSSRSNHRRNKTRSRK